MEIHKLEKLGDKIKELKKPHFSDIKRAKMKQTVLSSIKHGKSAGLYPSLQKLKDLISSVASKTKPNSIFKARLGETLYAFTKSKKSSFAWQWQKVFASALVVVITFMAATVYVSDIPVIKAARQTTLTSVSGSVEIVRNGEIMQAEANMYLQQGDILVTGANGTAVIRYIDDSVSRLSPKSELIINKLYQDQNNKSKTEVEIELTQGRVWNQVVNIVGKDSTFTVESQDVTAETSEKASFDISVNKVAVFENKVEVSLKDKTQLVVEGYALDADYKVTQVERISLNSKEDAEWVSENIELDKEYKYEMEEEDKEDSKSEAGLTPESPFYSAKKINESTKLLLTINADDNAKLKIDIAIKRLNEATVYINEDKSREAGLLLKEFSQLVTEVSESIRGSEDVKHYFENALAEEAKDLSVVLPDEPLYKVKEAVRDAKKKVLPDDQEKRGVVLEEAEEKLIEAKELIKEEKPEIAQETLIEVQEDVIDAAYDDIDSEDEDVIEEHVEALSTAKVLIEVVEEQASDDDEIAKLVEVTHTVLEDDIEDSTDVEMHSANPILSEEEVISDAAVILDL